MSITIDEALVQLDAEAILPRVTGCFAIGVLYFSVVPIIPSPKDLNVNNHRRSRWINVASGIVH